MADQTVADNWEDDAAELFDPNAVIDKRVECPICHGEGKVTEEEKIRVEDRMKAKPSTKAAAKPYNENRGVQTNEREMPLDDPIAEKQRLRKIAENADAKILDDMFGGKADDAFISDTEKGLNMIKLDTIIDYQQLAYKLGKRMTEARNATFALEFLQCAIRQCGGSLNSDDFQKLASTCNVMKEERRNDEKAVTKKGKKKNKAALKIPNVDAWFDDNDDAGAFDDDYNDDFMCLVCSENNEPFDSTSSIQTYTKPNQHVETLWCSEANRCYSSPRSKTGHN